MSYYKRQISFNLKKDCSKPKQEIYTIPISQEKGPKRPSIGSIDWTANQEPLATKAVQKVKKF